MTIRDRNSFVAERLERSELYQRYPYLYGRSDGETDLCVMLIDAANDPGTGAEYAALMRAAAAEIMRLTDS